ncbi:MAG: hypothetical protein CM15mP74_09910 [Halieaceae bacterium]|nr:MAG: hypothetical protein CM15mP74_09910 [Halieaceae bacterium]
MLINAPSPRVLTAGRAGDKRHRRYQVIDGREKSGTALSHHNKVGPVATPVPNAPSTSNAVTDGTVAPNPAR